MPGVIKPIIIHEGTLNERFAPAYAASLDRVNEWFAATLGSKLTIEPVRKLVGPTSTWLSDPYGNALGFVGRNGHPAWQDNEILLILLAGIPHTTPGLGGAPRFPAQGEPSVSGVVVKDGDALVSMGAAAPGFHMPTLGMLAHELGHALGANDHEDPPGPNIESGEWRLFPDVEWDAENVDELSRSVFLAPVAPPPPARSYDEGYRDGYGDGRGLTLTAITNWAEQQRAMKT
jgi:hypothetical protein